MRFDDAMWEHIRKLKMADVTWELLPDLPPAQPVGEPVKEPVIVQVPIMETPEVKPLDAKVENTQLSITVKPMPKVRRTKNETSTVRKRRKATK